MSVQRKSAAVGAGLIGGGAVGIGVADIGGVGDILSVGGAGDVVSAGGAGDVVTAGGAGDVLSGSIGDAAGLLGFLGNVVVGVVIGGVIVAGFLLLLGVFGVVVEVGQRRAEQVPAHLRAVPSLTPRTLRWVRGLLPGDEGAAWLAEVTSCLAEAHDKSERRRYLRSYRRGVPRLIWTSWALHWGGSRSRKLS